jgi:acetyl esterase
MFDAMDSEDIASSTGLTVRTEVFTSAPDGNTVKIQYFRPDNDEAEHRPLLQPQWRRL